MKADQPSAQTRLYFFYSTVFHKPIPYHVLLNIYNCRNHWNKARPRTYTINYLHIKFVYQIITHEPLDQLVSKFDWRTWENQGNVPSFEFLSWSGSNFVGKYSLNRERRE